MTTVWFGIPIQLVIKAEVGNLLLTSQELVQQGFDPDELEMNEIGYKGSFLNDSLNLSVGRLHLRLGQTRQVIKVAVVQGSASWAY